MSDTEKTADEIRIGPFVPGKAVPVVTARGMRSRFQDREPAKALCKADIGADLD